MSQNAPPPPLWTVRDVAAYLGSSAKYVYTLVEQNRIPFTRGPRLRFRPDSIEAWVASREIKAVR